MSVRTNEKRATRPADGDGWRAACDQAGRRKADAGSEESPAGWRARRELPRHGDLATPCRAGKGCGRQSFCGLLYRFARRPGNTLWPVRALGPMVRQPLHRPLKATHTDIGAGTDLREPLAVIEDAPRYGAFRHALGAAEALDNGKE